jgi:hypothetical protein
MNMTKAHEVVIDNAVVKGFFLCLAASDFCKTIKSEFERGKNTDVALQIEELFVPLQSLQGDANQFGLMVYPIPRLTSEQRKQLEFKEVPDEKLSIINGHVTISFDEFHKINWLYLDKLSEVHKLIADYMRSIAYEE